MVKTTKIDHLDYISYHQSFINLVRDPKICAGSAALDLTLLDTLKIFTGSNKSLFPGHVHCVPLESLC